MEVANKFCLQCGEKIVNNAEFCPKCGAKQVSVQDQSARVDANQNASGMKVSSVNSEGVQTGKKSGMFIFLGWLTAVVSLFIPIIGIASIIFGALVINRKKVTAGVVLIVFAVIFIYLGMTGFSQGFFGAL